MKKIIFVFTFILVTLIGASAQKNSLIAMHILAPTENMVVHMGQAMPCGLISTMDTSCM